MRFRWLYGLLPVWAQRCGPWGSKPINIQATVPGGDAFAKALSVFTPWRRLTSPPTTSSLHPLLPASQQVPSLQLPCICGAIPVRGGRQKYSWQSRGFGAGALFALGQTLDSSNILIFLLISQLLCCACVSLYVSVHFDRWGVTVHVAFVTAP